MNYQNLWDYIDENHQDRFGNGSATLFAKSIGKTRQQVSFWNTKQMPEGHEDRWHSAIVHNNAVWALSSGRPRKDRQYITVNDKVYCYCVDLAK